jgi:hypothetical protein
MDFYVREQKGLSVLQSIVVRLYLRILAHGSHMRHLMPGLIRTGVYARRICLIVRLAAVYIPFFNLLLGSETDLISAKTAEKCVQKKQRRKMFWSLCYVFTNCMVFK